MFHVKHSISRRLSSSSLVAVNEFHSCPVYAAQIDTSTTSGSSSSGRGFIQFVSRETNCII